MSRTVIPFGNRPGATGAAGADRAVYTVREVAHLLDLALGTAYALVRAGEIPAKKIGARWVIPRAAFHAWLDDCRPPAEPDPPAWSGWQFGNRRGVS
jgi:excisionase family DNA binding protein